MTTKVCKVCNCEKDITEFHILKGGKLGRHPKCKMRRSEYRKIKYYENHDYNLNKSREKRIRNVEYYKNYYQENKDKILLYMDEYRLKNFIKIKRYQSEYDKSPAGRLSRSRRDHNRYSFEKSHKATLTLEQWNKILSNQGNKCAMCGKKFSYSLIPEKDHIVPLSKGGSLTFENVQALCKSCNSSKSNKIDRTLITSWLI